MFRRLARLCLVLTLAGIFAMVTNHSRASAQALTPPPPLGATCNTTGSGIFCRGVATTSGTNQDAGISCGAFDVLITFDVTTTYQLRYNADGLATQGTFHSNAPATFINSVTGTTITANSHQTETVNFSTPGDLSTATRTVTGAAALSTGQGFGLVTHDVGRITVDATGNILFEGGPHDQFDDFPGFVSAVCSALA
jgi:hypothetical protein